MENLSLLPKDPKVCEIKPLFDQLQAKDLMFLNPIDVSNLVDLPVSIHKYELPPIYLWNQISDPNLGVHDFLKVEEEDVAEFKWVVVDGQIIPIDGFCDEDKKPSDIQLLTVMNNAYKKGKFVSYFIAEGNYEGKNGIHFCLVPYNDIISCQVLEIMFGPDLIEKVKNSNNPDSDEELENLDLNSYFNPDVVKDCNDIFTEHFKKSLDLIEIPV